MTGNISKEPIDYDALKKKGFLRQKQEGFFILRTRSTTGNYDYKQLKALSDIARKYGRCLIHATTRQGIEIPFIAFKDIERVEEEIKKADILFGTSGPRVRAMTACPGNNWCKRGLINTFELFDRIEKEMGIICGTDLPHKLKIAISGCPNKCTRAEATEIGIHGEIDTKSPDRKIGYAVYLGGRGGKNPQIGFKLNKIFTIEEVLSLVKSTVTFYKENAKSRQRLGELIDETGKDKFFAALGL